MQQNSYNNLSAPILHELSELVKEADEIRDNNAEFMMPIQEEFVAMDKRYIDKELHSQGGMKKVSKVLDVKTNRNVAIAELKPGKENDETIAQFLREGRVTAALDHPNIVPVYDIGLNDSGNPYFTMKFLKDQHLQKVLKELAKQNPLYTREYTFETLLDIFIKISEAIAYAHSKGVIHLDLKPENIMIGDYGEVYVCDWGIAKIVNAPEIQSTQAGMLLDATALNAITLNGVVKGTPGFMAPEQINPNFGAKDQQTDIYALGTILYSLLTFKTPFANTKPKQILHETLHGKPRDIEELSYFPVPEGVVAICRKAMSKKKSERYRSVHEIISDIRSFQSGFVTTAEEINVRKKLLLLYSRNKWRYIAGFTALFVSISTIYISKKIIDNKDQSLTQNIDKLEEQKKKEIEKLRRKSDRKSELQSKKIKSLQTALRNELNKTRQVIESPPIVQSNVAYFGDEAEKLFNPQIPFQKGTLAFWFKPFRPETSFPHLFQIGNVGWHLLEDDNVGGLISIGGQFQIPGEDIGYLLWDQWQHFACVVDNNRMVIFYINGKPFYTGQSYSGNEGLSLGGSLSPNDKSGQFRGHFKEVSLWDKVLSREEIVLLRSHSLTGNEDKLLAYYNFKNGAEDLSANKNHLTINGKVSFKAESVDKSQAISKLFEAEEVKLTPSGGKVAKQGGMPGRWSFASQVWWVEAKVGDKLKMTFKHNEETEGTLQLALTLAGDYGKFDFYLNGRLIKKRLNLYSPILKRKVFNFTNQRLKKGENNLTVIQKEKDPRSISNIFGIDIIGFKKE